MFSGRAIHHSQSQKLETFAFGEPGTGTGERFVDGKLGGVVAVRCGEGAELAEVTKSEDAGFESAGAFEAPAVFSDGLGEIDLKGAHRFE